MKKISLLIAGLFSILYLSAQTRSNSFTKDLSTPFCGTYTVGDASSDFLNLKEAVDSLNACGISCTVVFEIKPGTYNSQYIIDSLYTQNLSDSIVFSSQSGLNTDVVITSDSSNFVFMIDSTNHVIFDNISFTSDSAETILYNNFSNYTGLNNCRFLGKDTTMFLVKSNESSGLLFNNNYFENSDIAIDVRETGQKSKFISNTFENQISYSIKLKDQIEYNVYKNNINSVASVAIDVSNSDNGNISSNNINIDDLVGNAYFYPINIGSNYDTTIISNNFIKCVSPSNGVIRLSGSKYVFVNNTVVSNSGAVVKIGGDDNTLLNNIFYNKGTGYSIFIWSGSGNMSDYNCYFTYGNFGKFGATECVTLQNWQNITSLDQNSIFYRPTFFSENDLHTNFAYLDNMGTPISYVSVDIDDEPRDATNPDIGADEFTSSCNGALSGFHTIGISGEYTTINDAVNALYDCGIDTSVTFIITPGTYNEQVYIDSIIPDIDNADFISFVGQTIYPSDVVVSYDADTTTDNYIFKLDGIDRITIKDISLNPLDDYYSTAIVFTGNSNNNVFDSIIFNGSTADYWDYNNAKNSSSIYGYGISEIASDILIKNCNFNNNNYGIYVKSNTNHYNINYSIQNNNFNNQLTGDIFFADVSNILFQENNITRTTSSTVSLSYSSVKVISDNTINCNKNKWNINEGTALNITCSNTLISNNFIVSKENGIRVYSNTKIYNNSLFINKKGIEFGDNTKTYECKNNIVVADGYYSRCLYSYSEFSNHIFSDNNNLYRKNNAKIAEFALNPPFNTLASWQNYSAQDANSLSTNPYFTSSTDLHTTNVLFDGKAEALVEVTEDIDGDPRDATNPDIGADEFTNPSFYIGADTSNCYNTSIVLEAGNGFDTYLWSTGSDSSTTLIDSLNSVTGTNSYTVSVTTNGNTYIDTINVTVNKPQAAPQDVYCLNQNKENYVEIFAGQNASYFWGIPNYGDTTQSVLVANEQIYTVTVTDIYGCEEVQEIQVLKDYGAGINYSDTTVCNDDTLFIDAMFFTENPHGDYNILWSTGDTSFTLVIDSAKYTVGDYTFSVEVTNLNGCVSYDTVGVTIEDCTNIKYLDDSSVFIIYPNPAKDILNIKFTNSYLFNSPFQIFDITGKTIFKDILLTNNQVIDISNIDKGIYILKIRDKSVKLIIE